VNTAVRGELTVPRRIPLHLGSDPGARISLRALRRTLGVAPADGVVDTTVPVAAVDDALQVPDGVVPAPVADVVLAEGLRGDRVFNRMGERLGNIRDVLIDLRSGRIVYAALSCDGDLAFDDRLRPVPWPALARDAAGQCFVLDIARDAWLAAPAFGPDHDPDLRDVFFARTVHAYYGQQAYWEALQDAG
jgi:hypothetical protein